LIGALYVALVLTDPPLGIAAWVALNSLASLGRVGLALTGGMVVIAVAALASLRRGDMPALAERGTLLAPIALLVGWFVVSLAWSQDAGKTGEILYNWLFTAALIVAVVITVRTPRDVRVVLGGLVVGPVMSVLVGFAGNGGVTPPAQVATTTSVGGRLVGGIGDPNFLALVIVPAIVLAAVLGRGRPLMRMGAAVAIGILVVGLIATQSRGGLLATVMVFVAALVLMGGQRHKVVLMAAVAVGLGVVYLSGNPAALERVTGGAENKGSGRTELWAVALKASGDHPIVGVGLNNFIVHEPGYADRVGPLQYADLIAERPHVVHNTYLEALVETGVIGLLLLLAALTAGLRAMWSATQMFDRRGEHELAQLSRAVLLATIAVLTGALFLSLRSQVTLWCLLTLGVVLLTMARRPTIPARAP
jgi:O-antigen ligase